MPTVLKLPLLTKSQPSHPAPYTASNAHIDALAASLLDRRHTASITMLPSAGGLSLDAAGGWPMVVVVVRMWRMARGWRACVSAVGE